MVYIWFLLCLFQLGIFSLGSRPLSAFWNAISWKEGNTTTYTLIFIVPFPACPCCTHRLWRERSVLTLPWDKDQRSHWKWLRSAWRCLLSSSPMNYFCWNCVSYWSRKQTCMGKQASKQTKQNKTNTIESYTSNMTTNKQKPSNPTPVTRQQTNEQTIESYTSNSTTNKQTKAIGSYTSNSILSCCPRRAHSFSLGTTKAHHFFFFFFSKWQKHVAKCTLCWSCGAVNDMVQNTWLTQARGILGQRNALSFFLLFLLFL